MSFDFFLKKRIYVSFLFYILFLCVVPLYSAEKEKNFSSEYSAPGILGFARYLISKEEYYRADVELRRLNSYYPGFLDPEKSYITELYLLFKGGRYTDINEKKPGNSIRAISVDRIFKTDVYLNEMDFTRAEGILSGYSYNEENDIAVYIYKRTFLTYLLLRNIDKAKEFISGSLPEDNELYLKGPEAIKYTEESFDSLKNPWISLTAGIVPGMGYVHAGNKPTGIVAMIVVSFFSALTFISFKTDNKPVGIFAGAAATFFYTGSIVGGYLASKEHNRNTIAGLRDYLTEQMSLAEDREKIYTDYGIGSAGQK